jgi:prepilin-type N-terminal cleavage/methylation domain-containing protein
MTRPRRRGFTLIETVAAIIILAVAIPPMLWTVREAHHQRANPMLASKARWLAVEKLEDIIADRHSTGARGYSWLITGNYPAETPVTGFTGFDRTVTFLETDATLVTPTPGGGYMNVTVTVSWTDANANAQSLAISTVLTDYSPT